MSNPAPSSPLLSSPHRTDRFSYATTVRTAKRGLAFGLAYGLAQDVLRAAKGTAGVPAWMRWIGVGTAEHGGLVGHQQQQKRQPI